MIRFYKTQWNVKVFYPSLFWQKPSNDTIYLTFDDGPDAEVTPWVLEELDRVGAKATFFCLGTSLESNFDLAKQLISKRHLIANHGYHHLDGWKISVSDFKLNMAKSGKLIDEVGGQSKMIRPPYGHISRSQLRALDSIDVIMWSHLSWDFDRRIDPIRSISKLKVAAPGSILVFHDTQQSFPILKQILPEVLNCFSDRGLKFETLQ